MNYEEGLQQSYANDDGLYQDGNTLYVAGTRNLNHVGEWWKIPAFKAQSSEIYSKARDHLENHPEIDTLVGHSYGGSAVLQLQKENNKYRTITYGAPVLDPIPRNPLHKPERYCNMYDPVCATDFGASKSRMLKPWNPNPHSYYNTPRPNHKLF